METTGGGSGGQSASEEAMLGRLAARALELVRDATVIGLGSGRAASAFIRALGAEARRGRRVLGVPTSEATAHLAREVGIPLTGLDGPSIDVTVDGADEVDPALNMIKGYGGALVRERIVAAASGRQLILVGEEKIVTALGSRGRLPVEVVAFALPLSLRRLARLGLEPVVRTVGGKAFVSDNGNPIVDCRIGPIENAPAFEAALRAVPGVVDTGLFIGTASMVLVAEADSIAELRRPAGP
ncbi:MAG TPA: ribose-5-phosphate isomerase RpiA [Candidatus Methylomirabilis sp.]|nr:ribose-5-phosphate isomerase RpiA [Candidatus Methylomirabilis sp.]